MVFPTNYRTLQSFMGQLHGLSVTRRRPAKETLRDPPHRARGPFISQSDSLDG
ncbi:hypothetical protein PAXRUDRAFT_828577 [Paxillus rubicundulus Ve08.2h10]|uniref:Uncharacterized protein n=1 Tax=Paxillus rubicundulus Ve08.2h10 TaxID=930991 RepID=A0A0D0E140_9AGAM|nr:hypothetical protein PAXRUDRAFT_828577 [Paxillus rubicundulus Ve08.2h10]